MEFVMDADQARYFLFSVLNSVFFFMCVCVSFVRLIDARIYNPTQEGKGWRAPNLTKRKEKKR